jgi:hypothetical protein
LNADVVGDLQHGATLRAEMEKGHQDELMALRKFRRWVG